MEVDLFGAMNQLTPVCKNERALEKKAQLSGMTSWSKKPPGISAHHKNLLPDIGNQSCVFTVQILIVMHRTIKRCQHG